LREVIAVRADATVPAMVLLVKNPELVSKSSEEPAKQETEASTEQGKRPETETAS
jgi:hypothetical protein